MIDSCDSGKIRTYCFYVVLVSALIIAGCASTQPVASLSLSQNFDESQYVNPQDFGYALSLREIERNPPADSSFVPVAVKGGMRQAFGKVTYPPEAQKQEIKGRVLLQLYVNENSSLTRAEVLESPHKLLTNAALEAAQKWDYNAGSLNGTPVNSFIRVPLNFRMETQEIDIQN